MKEAIFFCIVGLPLFGKEGSGTPVIKILVRALLLICSETALLSFLAMPCMLVYMYILPFVYFHVLYISYMFRGPYVRLAVELNMSPS